MKIRKNRGNALPPYFFGKIKIALTDGSLVFFRIIEGGHSRALFIRFLDAILFFKY